MIQKFQIDALKASLEDLRAKLKDRGDRIQSLSEKMRDACSKIEASWSGSYLDTHWDLYFGDFEQPPYGMGFNIEWGLTNGMPQGWSQRTGDEVRGRLQELFSPEVKLEDFKEEVDEITQIAQSLQRECSMLQNALDPKTQNYEISLCKSIEAMEVVDDTNQRVGNAVLGGAVTRDSRAIMSRRRGTPVQTYYDAVGLKGLLFMKDVGNLVKDVGTLLHRLEDAPGSNDSDKIALVLNRFSIVERQLQKRHDGRAGFPLNDEYDVQDLLEALLRIFFDDVRAEEASPSMAGKATRIDFVLVSDNSAIEAKYVMSANCKKIRDELLVDIATYGLHPKVKKLYCFVYDPEGLIKNPRGFETDIAGQSTDGLAVECFIRP